MANTEVKKELLERRLDNLLEKKLQLLQTLAATKKEKDSLSIGFQHSAARIAQRELLQIEMELKPLYAQMAIGNKLAEGFNKQSELDVGRVFNRILGDDGKGAVSYPHFPSSKDFKGTSEAGSFPELQEYIKWLISETYPLIFDENGDFLPSCKSIFEDPRFERYKDQPGKLKIEVLKSILVCTVPQNDTSIETLVKQNMQNELFKDGIESFNEPEAFNLKALQQHLNDHFEKPETREMFDAYKEGLEGMKTNDGQIEINKHIEAASRNRSEFVDSEKSTNTAKKVSSNLLITAFNYLCLPARAIYVAAKAIVSLFQKSDLDYYNPEKGWNEAASPSSSTVQPSFSGPFFSFKVTDAKTPENSQFSYQ